jgi:DtxR family Mn-dependent transcriptional regulator
MAVHDKAREGESAEMYLKTIFELTVAEPLVPISILADRLGISPVSATEMIHRMKSQALIEHERYKGVHLTDRGAIRAQRILRRHRLWERFLADHLHLPWESVHDFACRLEHASGRKIVEALAEFLNNPQVCPHGNPIPSAGGEMALPSGVSLNKLQPGDRGLVERITPESSAVLTYAAHRNIKPGVEVSIRSVNEYDQLRTLYINNKEEVISESITARIFLRTFSGG